MLFAILLASALIALATLPAKITLNANTHQQRVIIDPATGTVSGLAAAGSSEAAAFDVGAGEQPSKSKEAPASAEEEKSAQPSSLTNLPALRSAPQRAQLPNVPRTGDSLVTAPAPEITETVDKLALPKRNEKGLTPSQIYARGFTRGSKDRHVLAVVITDAGFSADSLEAILSLPKEVSVAFSPYATDAAKQITVLRNAGHEAWTMLPAQGENYPQDDPGPLGLIGTLSSDQTLQRLHAMMAATLGSVGFILPPDETVSAYPKAWNATLGEISTRGLLLLSTRPDRTIEQVNTDRSSQSILTRADMILDSTPSAAFIKTKLDALKDQASDQSQFVVVASARPQTLAMLREFLTPQSLDGLTLAPLSALYSQEKIKQGWTDRDNLIQHRNK